VREEEGDGGPWALGRRQHALVEIAARDLAAAHIRSGQEVIVEKIM